jgi:hypothetical protein
VKQRLLVVGQTKSGKVRRVPLPSEFQKHVGQFVPFKHYGSFNLRVARHSGVRGFHVHRLRHDAARRIIPHERDEVRTPGGGRGSSDLRVGIFKGS